MLVIRADINDIRVQRQSDFVSAQYVFCLAGGGGAHLTSKWCLTLYNIQRNKRSAFTLVLMIK